MRGGATVKGRDQKEDVVGAWLEGRGCGEGWGQREGLRRRGVAIRAVREGLWRGGGVRGRGSLQAGAGLGAGPVPRGWAAGLCPPPRVGLVLPGGAGRGAPAHGAQGGLVPLRLLPGLRQLRRHHVHLEEARGWL